MPFEGEKFEEIPQPEEKEEEVEIEKKEIESEEPEKIELKQEKNFSEIFEELGMEKFGKLVISLAKENQELVKKDSFSIRADNKLDPESFICKTDSATGEHYKVRADLEKVKYDEFVESSPRFLKEELKRDGTKMELVTNVLLRKIFGDKVINFRTMVWDDRENHVDHFLIHRETGEVLCTIDEVADTEIKYREKCEKVKERNEKGGFEIKYGLKFFPEEEKFASSSFKNIPGICLGLSPKEIDAVIYYPAPSFNEFSPDEKVAAEKIHKQFKERILEAELISEGLPEKNSKEKLAKTEFKRKIDIYKKLLIP
jgi:hypothetical protein